MHRPFIIMDTTGVLTFDGLEAVTWKVLMKHTVTARGVRLINLAPGQLYCFIFKQDDVGGHTIEWPPAQVSNGGRLDTDPDATTVINFVGDTGSRLEIILPPAWGNT